MYCKHCGKEIDDNSSFCKFCGKAQDNRVSTPNSLSAPNGLIDFITKKPILSFYVLWVIINTVCLCSGEKCGEYFNILYPKLDLGVYQTYSYHNYFDLDYYQITDFVVYVILIPLVIFLGYHYFKKVTSTKHRIYWALWFLFNLLMYKLSNFRIDDCFFPFTMTKTWGYDYYLFSYDGYDLSELVFYTMIIPIAYWGYLFYKDKNKGTNKMSHNESI